MNKDGEVVKILKGRKLIGRGGIARTQIEKTKHKSNYNITSILKATRGTD